MKPVEIDFHILDIFSRMSDAENGEKRQEFCRLCSKSGISLRHIFNDKKLKEEILPKIHVVFPHILVSKFSIFHKEIFQNVKIFKILADLRKRSIAQGIMRRL